MALKTAFIVESEFEDYMKNKETNGGKKKNVYNKETKGQKRKVDSTKQQGEQKKSWPVCVQCGGRHPDDECWKVAGKCYGCVQVQVSKFKLKVKMLRLKVS
ncbi:hypothetical protein Taro_049734 [Colocasia esculenta]|uniref:Uncharacterized protein n=1 Tax=Colocasia esculenta TaxID=4460 RepID=A0A843XBU7_COLES|nr:hypothetical protein [Colocasia esculenta]